MGLARSLLTVLGGASLAGGTLYAGLVARDATDYRQTVREIGFSRLLASRTGPLDIGEGDYFRELSDLLKGYYVEPVTDDKKLVAGAVRGMVASLGDPNSMFFSPEEFRAFKGMRQGRYEGIGAWLAFVGDKTPAEAQDDADASDRMYANLPRLTVVSVTPDGAAAKAGLKPGDVVESVGGEWVVNGGPILEFRKAQRAFAAKKLPLAKINELRKDLQKKLDHSLMPLKARERLTVGTSGTISAEFVRGGKPLPVTLTRGVSNVAEGAQGSGAYALAFTDGAPERLAAFLKGKSSATLDLRNNVFGDDETMRRTLAAIAPKGSYGVYVDAKGHSTPVLVAKGAETTPKLSLLVDESTRGAAQTFALALKSHGLATMSEGAGAMATDRNATEVVQLTDGSGYTLSTGEYRVTAPAPKSKAGDKAGSGKVGPDKIGPGKNGTGKSGAKVKL